MAQKYIALLRGINVGGHKKIKMADLRTYLQELPFEAVQTYIQSGNIVFESSQGNPADLEKQIHDKIFEKCGFEVAIIVRTPAELKEIIAACPYSPENGQPLKQIYFTLLANQPATVAVEALKSFNCDPELWEIKGTTLYSFAANGAAKSKLNNSILEQKLKVTATTRNWNTMNKLLAMAN